MDAHGANGAASYPLTVQHGSGGISLPSLSGNAGPPGHAPSLAHVVHPGMPIHPSGSLAPHTHLPVPMSVSVPVSLNPSVSSTHPHPHHHHHPHHSSFYDQYAAERVVMLEAELAKAHREIERLRVKLADVDKERAKRDSPKAQSRYWTPDEHKRFLEALQEFGPKDVRAIANFVGTRNATQVRTHAQKYFLRMAREAKGGSALQAARRRSMSESDLALVGTTVTTPPGSPVMKEKRFGSSLHTTATNATMPLPISTSGPTPTDADLSQPLPPPPNTSPISVPAVIAYPKQTTPRNPSSPRVGVESMDTTAPISNSKPIPTQQRTSAPGPTAAKPPAPTPNVADSSGISLLSLVATERGMQNGNTKI